jgi:hypothetical protein
MLLTPMALGLGTAAGAAAGLAPTVISALSPDERKRKKQLRSDVKRMEQGQLGFSQAKKRQMLKATSLQLADADKEARQQATRMQLAGGPTNASGANALVADAQKQIGDSMSDSRGQIEALSQEQAIAEKNRILAAQERESDRRHERVQQAAQNALVGAKMGAKATEKISDVKLNNFYVEELGGATAYVKAKAKQDIEQGTVGAGAKIGSSVNGSNKTESAEDEKKKADREALEEEARKEREKRGREMKARLNAQLDADMAADKAFNAAWANSEEKRY